VQPTQNADAQRRGRRLVKAGAWWHVIGCGPLYVTILLAGIGVLPRDINPIGLGLLAFFSFLPSLALVALGAGMMWLARKGGPR
jgi:hypothetical protein